jgi:hypothetical protein
MDKDKKLPKGLYDIVSELVTFIDQEDSKRKEKNVESTKDFILNVDKNNNGLKK